MAATVPAASAVTAGSGPRSGPASACCSSAVPSGATGAGWPASAGSAAGCPSPGVSAGGASSAGASGAACVQVSAMPGRLPLTRVAVPFFSCASSACRAAAVLIPARAAMTVTVAPAGSADRAVKAAAAGLSPAAGATGAGAGIVAVSAALRAAWGRGSGACHDGDSVSILRRNSRFRFDCAGVFWTTIALVSDVKSSGSEAFQIPFSPGQGPISPLPMQSTPFPSLIHAFPRQFPRIPSLTALN